MVLYTRVSFATACGLWLLVASQLLIVGARFEHFSALFLRNSLKCDPGDDDNDDDVVAARTTTARQDRPEKLYKFISWQLTGITLTKFINLLRIGNGVGVVRFESVPCLINRMESGNGEKLALWIT